MASNKAADAAAPSVGHHDNHHVTKTMSTDGQLAEAIRAEHEMTFRQALRLYPKAIFWSAYVSMGVIMLAFDPQLIGNLYATKQFKHDFGHLYNGDVRI